jgi:hypothetical protein
MLIGGRRKPEAPAGCPGWAKALFFTGDEPAAASPDFDAWREAVLEDGLDALWATHRTALLAEWVLTRPGTRPAWWWWHDAPEMRQFMPGQAVVSGCGAYFINEGVPLAFPAAAGELIYEGTVLVESQATFLRRLGLLLPGEKGRVKRSAWAPEVFDFAIPGEAA